MFLFEPDRGVFLRTIVRNEALEALGKERRRAGGREGRKQKVRLFSFLPGAPSSWIAQSALYSGFSADSTFTAQPPPPPLSVDARGLGQELWGPTGKGRS